MEDSPSDPACSGWMGFFFLSLILLAAGYGLKHTLPFAAGLSFLLLGAFEFVRFRFLLRRYSSFPACPALPPRFSDLQNPPLSLPSLPAGIRVGYEADLEWKGVRSFRIASPPGSGAFSASLRGSYTLNSQSLVLENFCGFFRCTLPGPAGMPVLIYPAPGGADQNGFSEKPQAPEREVLYTPLKNQDYFESRPYYSGDDPRRINWKMMARHGELFIREGSGCLPSRSRVLILVDPGKDSRLPTRFDRRPVSKGDRLLRSAAALVAELRREGCRIDLAGPSVLREELEKMSERTLQDILASVRPVRLTADDIPENGAVRVYYFSSGIPERALLDRLQNAEKKLLILPGGDETLRKGSDRRNHRHSDTERDRGVALQEGWIVAYS